MKKILIVSSSSGGHIYPSIALGKILKEKGYQVTYLGIKNQMEEKIIPNIKLIDIPNSFKKSLNIQNFLSLIKHKNQIIEILKESDLVIAFGGFITFVVTILNLKTRKKIFLHEQNVILGDSIKFSYPFCDKLLISFPNHLRKLKKAVYINNPTTYSIKKRNNINIDKPKVLFVFGSLSSKSCLLVVKEFLINTKLKNEFIVVTGEKNYQMFENIQNSNVKLYKKIDMKNMLNYVDLVFSRGGATTLLELMKSGVEVVCIPSPNVKHNHQYLNAKYFEDKGFIRIVKEKNFTPKEIEKQIVNLKRINQYNDDNLYLNIIEEVMGDD